jgi:hypothetical protein
MSVAFNSSKGVHLSLELYFVVAGCSCVCVGSTASNACSGWSLVTTLTVRGTLQNSSVASVVTFVFVQQKVVSAGDI